MATKSKCRVSFSEFISKEVAEDPVERTLAESGDDTDTDEEFREIASSEAKSGWSTSGEEDAERLGLCLKESTAVAPLYSGRRVWIQPREALYFSSI